MQSEPVAASESNAAPQSLCSPTVRPYRLVVLSVLALAAGIATTAWLEHLRFERFHGFLQARLRTVTATREAQVSEILVAPGQIVTAGQPLVRLKDTPFEQQVDAKVHEIEALEIELAQSQARLEVELEWRQKNIIEQIFDARMKRSQALLRLSQTPLRLEIGRTSVWETAPAVPALGKMSLVFNDRSVVQQTQSDSATPESRESEVDLCSQHIHELERIKRDLPEKISRSMGVDLARTRLAHARTELTRLESQKRDLTLVADASGMVGVFHKEVGDHVAAHEPIVQLLDEEQPYLLLQIPSPRIADFSPGTVVDLRFPGGKKGKGKVEEIPPQASPIPGDNSPIGETVITAHVDPVGTLWPSLPFGSSVEVRRRR